MTEFHVDNLGLPPLAGVCTYEQACRDGIDVDRNVDLLKRYNYLLCQLNHIAAAHLARTPEWELKCALAHHMWLDSEHATLLRKRVTEMREPPHGLDKVPDLRLESYCRELLRADTSAELVTGLYNVSRRALVDALECHLAEANPLSDYPTCRILESIIREQRTMIDWGVQATAALTRDPDAQRLAMAFEAHLRAYLTATQGISGELESVVDSLPPARNNGEPYRIDKVPRRDARFVDPYNHAAPIDVIYTDESKPVDERVYALLFKRLRELDVIEWMGPIIFGTDGKPWEYYHDMSRQLWDEARHSMYGEAGLTQLEIPFYRYPIDIRTSESINTHFEPLQAHAILWAIEQSLMPGKSGKRMEYQLARKSENHLMWQYQDYDWADEVLHAQIGRRWLETEFASYEQMATQAKAWREENWGYRDALNDRSAQRDWWDDFLAAVSEPLPQGSAPT